FGVRDIQFDRPQILVEPCAASEEVCNFCGTRRLGRSNALPGIGSVERQHALQHRLVNPAAADAQDQRAAFFVALSNYCRKAALDRDSAQNRADLDMGRETLAAQAASRSSAPISTAASASRLLAPRNLSNVALS